MKPGRLKFAPRNLARIVCHSVGFKSAKGKLLSGQSESTSSRPPHFLLPVFCISCFRAFCQRSRLLLRCDFDGCREGSFNLSLISTNVSEKDAMEPMQFGKRLSLFSSLGHRLCLRYRRDSLGRYGSQGARLQPLVRANMECLESTPVARKSRIPASIDARPSAVLPKALRAQPREMAPSASQNAEILARRQLNQIRCQAFHLGRIALITG